MQLLKEIPCGYYGFVGSSREFGREVFRTMFGGIKVDEDWRKLYNTELMQLFGHLDMLSFVRISQLNWIGHGNKMDSKRKVSQVFNNTFQ
jgi:hypothetical protein